MVHNVVIIGSGPAGLAAGIYAGRAKLNPLIIEGPQPGGQLMTTSAVENWPGQLSIEGPDLMIKMREQTDLCGATFLSDSVSSVDFSHRPFTLFTAGGQAIKSMTVIVATGAAPKKLHCKGESEYWGKGVSTCSVCDAPLYEGKEVIIVGSGNTAMTEAEHLRKIAKKITLVFIQDKPTATDPIKDKVLTSPIVHLVGHSTITEVIGDGQQVVGVMIENQKDKVKKHLRTDGVFIAIGTTPNTQFLQGHLETDAYGYLIVRNHTKTSVNGVFAAGDVSDFRYRQAVTSAGAGCMAALDAQACLAGH